MKSYYSKEAMNRFSNPKYFGVIEDADGVGVVGNERCGDEMEIYLSVKEGKITNASFRTLGCAAAIATSDVVCEIIIGKNLKDAVSLTEKEMVERLEYLPAVKVHCASLALAGVRAAVKNYEEK